MATAYDLARKEIGTKEIVGSKHNPKVVGWFAEVGHSWVNDDETPWCAAFVGAMLKRAGYRFTGKLNARSYADTPSNTEVSLSDVQEGDIVVFSRGNSAWQGHVGFFVRQTAKSILVLGGNQNNEVNEKFYSKSRLIGVYRPKRAATPASKIVGTSNLSQTAPPPPVTRPAPPTPPAVAPDRPKGLWGFLMALFGGKK